MHAIAYTIMTDFYRRNNYKSSLKQHTSFQFILFFNQNPTHTRVKKILSLFALVLSVASVYRKNI